MMRVLGGKLTDLSWMQAEVAYKTKPSLSDVKGLVAMFSIDAEDHHIVTLRIESL
jgi:hypothetical protein